MFGCLNVGLLFPCFTCPTRASRIPFIIGLLYCVCVFRIREREREREIERGREGALGTKKGDYKKHLLKIATVTLTVALFFSSPLKEDEFTCRYMPTSVISEGT
jgi:hypothetical protein